MCGKRDRSFYRRRREPGCNGGGVRCDQNRGRPGNSYGKALERRGSRGQASADTGVGFFCRRDGCRCGGAAVFKKYGTPCRHEVCGRADSDHRPDGQTIYRKRHYDGEGCSESESGGSRRHRRIKSRRPRTGSVSGDSRGSV